MHQFVFNRLLIASGHFDVVNALLDAARGFSRISCVWSRHHTNGNLHRYAQTSGHEQLALFDWMA
jgi:hypothetical protein